MPPSPFDFIEPPAAGTPLSEAPAAVPSENPLLGTSGSPLAAAMDWWNRGGLAGSLGLEPATTLIERASEEQNSLMDAKAPLSEIVKRGLDNPMLFALGPGSIRGFHGTPHLFPAEEGAPFGAFRDEAIGSGEGAQAYGWGHYVAGNRSVGENYQPTDQYQISGGGNKWAAFKRVPSQDPTKDISPNFETREEAQQWAKDNSGALLEVHILPEEHELLDWDKPLSEQAPGVQEKLRAMGHSWPREGEILRGGQRVKESYTPTGEELYHEIGKIPAGELVRGRNQDEMASKALHEAGIPGIKYLDAGSRAAGEGTSNYVIFHPSNLRIIGRNGQRLEPVDHDPFTSEAP